VGHDMLYPQYIEELLPRDDRIDSDRSFTVIRGLARWVRLVLLLLGLRNCPTPCWLLPAVPLALVRCCFDRELHRLAGPAIIALGLPDTRMARWRFVWSHCYQHEADLLLALQAARLTREWACHYVAAPESLPPDGAILITLHHAHLRLGNLRLSALVKPLGIIAGLRLDHQDDMPESVFTGPMTALYRRTFGPHVIYPEPASLAARQGLRLLDQGGYLVIAVDGLGVGDAAVVFGKALRVPRGPLWLARHSGKPIVPFIVMPERRGWRIWCGAPIAPTPEALAAAIEEAIRRAPTSWRSDAWTGWCQLSPHE